MRLNKFYVYTLLRNGLNMLQHVSFLSLRNCKRIGSFFSSYNSLFSIFEVTKPYATITGEDITRAAWKRVGFDLYDAMYEFDKENNLKIRQKNARKARNRKRVIQ